MVVLGGWLDLMILEVFSNLLERIPYESMIHCDGCKLTGFQVTQYERLT